MDVLAAAPPAPQARDPARFLRYAARSHGENERQAADVVATFAEEEDESQSCSGEKADPDESVLPPLRRLRRHLWPRSHAR